MVLALHLAATNSVEFKNQVRIKTIAKSCSSCKNNFSSENLKAISQ